MNISPQNVFDSMPDEIVIIDTQNTVVMANKAVIKNYGLRKDEIVGKKCYNVFHESRKMVIDCPIQKMLKSGRTTSVERSEKLNGSTKYYNVTAAPIRDEAGKIIQVVHTARDITQRKEAELALKRSRHRYRRLIQSSPLGIVSADSSGKIIDSNPMVVHMLGGPGVKQTRATNMLKDRSMVSSGLSGDIEECMGTGKNLIRERHIKSPWGKELNMRCHLTPLHDNDQKIIGVQLVMEDVTDRRKQEEELKKTNMNLLTIYRMSSSLQQAPSTKEILDSAIETFKSVGFDRVRIYLMEQGKLVGASASHLHSKEFHNVVLDEGVDKKAYSSLRNMQPVVLNDVEGKYTKVLEKGDVQVSASIPLLSQDAYIGVVSLDNKFSRKPIIEKDLRLLMTFANQIAIAIQNNMLYRENQNRLKTLSAMYDVSSALSGILDLDKILNLIVIKIVKLLKSDVCSILLWDDSQSLLIPKTIYDMQGQYLRESLKKADELVSSRTIKSMELQVIPDRSKIDSDELKNLFINAQLQSLLSVPFSIEKKPIGVINLYTGDKRQYTGEQLNLLQSLANQAAVIIQNSQLYSTIKDDKENLTSLLKISESINSTLDQDRLLEMILDRTVEFTRAKYGFIMLIQDDYLEVKLSRGMNSKKRLRTRIGEGITGRVAKTGKPIIVSEVGEEEKRMVNKGIRSEAAIPLITQDRVIGVLNLESDRQANFKRFQKSLHILTNQIAIAIENARLYDEIRNFNLTLKNKVELATKELREKNIALRKMDQLKSDFVSNVSHELRTPLTSIAGYTKLMAMEKLGQINEKQSQALDIILEEGERLTRMINNVLDLSKLESGRIKYKMSRFSLRKLVAETVRSMDTLARENEVSIVTKADKALYLKASRDLIKQVLINLVNNAIKFSNKGGTVTVGLSKYKDHVNIRVSDSGDGIPKELIPKLFDKFYQVDSSMTRQHGGSGLGLVIVKHIVEAHQGTINVESEAGKGSTFSVSLPMKQRPHNRQ